MRDLFLRFKEKIYKDIAQPEEKRFLLTVSGGIDSMVMWDLFTRTGFDIEIAHVNFQLRGEDSELDQQLVEKIAEKRGHRLHVLRENTTEYARRKGISIEMAAREIRYHFFYELQEKYQLDYICTAHQLDDLLETFFIALYQKGNIFKLTSLRTFNEKLYRPLLFFSRKEIDEYAHIHQTPYRDDYTNFSTIYLRNKIRNIVLPAIEEFLPQFKENAYVSLAHLHDAGNFLRYVVSKELDKYLTSPTEMDIQKLRTHPFAQWLLEQFLLSKGGKAAWASTILNHSREEALHFYSSDLAFIYHRHMLHIEPRNEEELELYYIDEDLETSHLPFELSLELKNISSPEEVITTSNEALIDFTKIKFPLLIRKWKAGDYFQPLGLNGKKKVSDFLTDHKVPAWERKNIYVMISEEKIIWIIGHRIAHSVAITKFPSVALHCQLNKRI
jgi:tRNA(Ile)-lysidine synthase